VVAAATIAAAVIDSIKPPIDRRRIGPPARAARPGRHNDAAGEKIFSPAVSCCAIEITK